MQVAFLPSVIARRSSQCSWRLESLCLLSLSILFDVHFYKSDFKKHMPTSAVSQSVSCDAL